MIIILLNSGEECKTMYNQIKVFTIVLAAAVWAIASVPAHALVIGDWENVSDGWIDWGQGQAPIDTLPEKYSYSTIGATHGNWSLHVKQSGWGQSLAIKLDEAQRAAFMVNSTFSIDMTVPANDGTIESGYTQINSVTMNADGPGWTTVVADNPINFYWWPGSEQRTQTLIIDYSAFRDAIASTSYIEIIFTLNTGGGAPPDMFFDNARLSGGPKPYDETIMEDGPVLYLRFESEEPADSSENNYWVEYGGGATIREYQGIGNAVYLNGGTNAYVAAANQTTAPGYSQKGHEYAFAKGTITFEFWANLESMHRYGMFFHQVGGWSSEPANNMERRAPGMGQIADEDGSNAQIRILNGLDDPNNPYWYPGIATPPLGQWAHYVLMYEEKYQGDPNAMQIQLYLNGAAAASTVVSSATGARLGPELCHLVIGGFNDRGYVYNNAIGLFDEFAIYPVLLGPERIAAHYQAGLHALTPQDCQDAWRRGMGLPGDINRDCKIDLADFAILAQAWLACNDPELFGIDLTCMPNW